MITRNTTKQSTQHHSSGSSSFLERLGPIILGIGVVISGVLVSPTVKESTAAVNYIQNASSVTFFNPHTNPDTGLNVMNREDQRDLGISREEQSSSPFKNLSRRLERGLQLIGGNEVFIAQR